MKQGRVGGTGGAQRWPTRRYAYRCSANWPRGWAARRVGGCEAAGCSTGRLISGRPGVAGFSAGKLADCVEQFMTINEFICYTDLSYKVGNLRPARNDRTRKSTRSVTMAFWRAGWACKPNAPQVMEGDMQAIGG